MRYSLCAQVFLLYYQEHTKLNIILQIQSFDFHEPGTQNMFKVHVTCTGHTKSIKKYIYCNVQLFNESGIFIVMHNHFVLEGMNH